MAKIIASIQLCVEVSFQDNRVDELQDQAYEAMKEHITLSSTDGFSILDSNRPYIESVGGTRVKKGDKINAKPEKSSP